MKWYHAAAVSAAALVGVLVTGGWLALRSHEHALRAEQLAAESYSTRSHLARELLLQMNALRSVAGFWEDYGRLDPSQWDDDARIELSHFQGFETLIWHDADSGIRYATSPDQGLALDRVPDTDRWRTLSPLLEGFDGGRGEAVIGPEVDPREGVHYRVRVTPDQRDAEGILVARVNVRSQLGQLLEDRSPGFAITVTWKGQTIYARGEAAPDLPLDWTPSGLIEIGIGTSFWRVTHAPTEAMAESIMRPTLPGLLASGWTVALLLGGLVLQYGRIRDRATAAERAEARYAELNQALEARVAERTAELEARTGDLETIHQSVSHDIRSPISTVAVSLELLRRQAQGAHSDAALEQIATANAQISDVVDRLNAYSTAAYVDLEREPIDVNAMVDTIIGQTADARNIEIVVETLPSCLAHPTLAQIVWHNLIGNAVKYTAGRKGARVDISASTAESIPMYCVRDNGIGFEADSAEEIVKPFVRLAGNYPGQGMGLAIVARIVRRHGGSLRAEGAPDAGAAFYFDFGPESDVELDRAANRAWDPGP